MLLDNTIDVFYLPEACWTPSSNFWYCSFVFFDILCIYVIEMLFSYYSYLRLFKVPNDFCVWMSMYFCRFANYFFSYIVHFFFSSAFTNILSQLLGIHKALSLPEGESLFIFGLAPALTCVTQRQVWRHIRKSPAVFHKTNLLWHVLDVLP